jgi:hypothetical protein
MAENESKGENVAMPDEVKATLEKSAELIETSRREVERARRIIRDTAPDAAQSDAETGDTNP